MTAGRWHRYPTHLQPVRWPLLLLIRVYQLTLSRLIRALLGNVCRFDPSCSAYAYECVRLHGAYRGGLLSAKRLSKCHPFHPGGYDPPPPVLKEG
ncbi:MAG: membrane protein insertion efficiency factor YidD [Deltaproteobacteria bacterium]|nr:membrane protein insertion efficiency factor YidD [Deltaproteobacteria bacterium]